MKATIWHNPKCGTSRKTLAILEETPGVEVEVIEYLKTPYTREKLIQLFKDAGMTAKEAIRLRGTDAEERGLPGMSDEASRSLYNRYLKARELVGESNDGVTYDKLLRTLRSQSSKIITDHKARGVEFAVVIKDNKVVLKAKPKL